MNFQTKRSTRSTTAPARPSRYSRGSRALALSSASVAGIAALSFAGNASAEPVQAPTPQRVAAVTTIEASPDRPVRVEHQVGRVMEGTADAGTPVMVTLYENSLHGSSLVVILGGPDSESFGVVEQAGPFIEDGVLDETVDVDGTLVHLEGTVAESGKPTRIVEPIQDGGEQVVSRGTNTPLATDVTVTIGGTTSPVEFAPAFAFDLETRKVTLYGR